MKKAVFLDRDGIVNVDTGYVCRIEDFCFTGDIFPLCRFFQDKGYLIFIITNQSGIGRGYYTMDQYGALTDWMLARFEEAGIAVSKVYFCPHHPTDGIGEYKIDCPCRKPHPGMIVKAAGEFNLDLKASILIGDRSSDIHAGIHAGVGRMFWVGGGPVTDLHAGSVTVVDDMAELIRQLESGL
ncbi:MAG: HAD family hydrolase [Desulfobacterales bacterium]